MSWAKYIRFLKKYLKALEFRDYENHEVINFKVYFVL